MDAGPILPEVRALLRERIDSYEQIEALLLLAADGSRSFTADEIADRLAVSIDVAREALDALRARALVDAATYRYAPGDAATDAAVRLLAHDYRERRSDVAKLMNQNAFDRIRNSASRAFADAFLFGRRPRDG
jgi:hypothetical protein